MKKYNRLKVAKKNPTCNHKFVTSSLKDYEILMKLKEKGYIITVIKSIELSISQYFKRNNQIVTIQNIEIDGSNVNVSFCKNDETKIIVIPKSELQTGNNTYEFSIACEEQPKVVEKEFEVKVKLHKTKENVLYLEL